MCGREEISSSLQTHLTIFACNGHPDHEPPSRWCSVPVSRPLSLLPLLCSHSIIHCPLGVLPSKHSTQHLDLCSPGWLRERTFNTQRQHHQMTLYNLKLSCHESVGSSKSQVSFAKEPYKRHDIHDIVMDMQSAHAGAVVQYLEVCLRQALPPHVQAEQMRGS